MAQPFEQVTMVLTSNTVTQVRQAVWDGNFALITPQVFEGVSLAGLLELCCACQLWETQITDGSHALFEHLTDQIALLAPVSAHLKRAIENPGPTTTSALVNDELLLQIFSNADDFTADYEAWDWFQETFVRRLQEAGIGRNWSYALAKVLSEMVNNVPDHSAATREAMSPAIVGCHITPGHVHFAVSDLGDGALVSLHRNPQWQGLIGSRQALVAIIEKNATSKAFHTEGSGFRELFAAFANCGGAMRLMSGNGVATVAISERGERAAVTSTCAGIPGMHVSASWIARARPGETILQQNWLTHADT